VVASGKARAAANLDIFAARHHTFHWSREYRIGPYNPLAGGVLTGRYKREVEIPAEYRLHSNEGYRQRYLDEVSFDLVERFLGTADELNVTPAQLSLAWVMAEPRVTAPILGARSLEQLQDSLQGAELSLNPEQRASVPAVEAGRWIGTDPVYDR
jgi:aryl-alcohol dehydrogenase-like predicted oxidoreductase